MSINNKKFFGIILFVLFILGSVTYAAEPSVSNVFDNAYILDVLRDVSAQTGVVVIADSTVNGQITLSLDNVPLEEALQRILTPGGYVFRKLNGYYLVGAPDVKNPSFILLSETEIIKLHYAKAENIVKTLADSLGLYVKVDKDNNSLVVTAPQQIINRVKSDLALIDQPPRQVMLEALVVEVSKNGQRDLGLDWWEWTKKTASASGDQNTDTLQVKDFAFNISHITEDGLSSFLASLKVSVAKGDARIEANPRVATIDGQSAEIFVGKERYYYLTSQTDSSGSTTSSTLEAIKSGITLKILPQVAENGDITVKIEPEVSDVTTENDSSGNSSNGLPVISSRRVSTTARVKDGESIVLGGLIQRTKQKLRTKVPFLGDIPILSFFFSRTKTVEEENEVLIIITPKILGEQAGPDDATKARMGIN